MKQTACRWAFGLLMASLLAACGGRQGPNDSGSNECPTIGEGMASADWARWSQCTKRAGDSVNRDSCVAALKWAPAATPEALGTATACVLEGSDRSRLTRIGDALHELAFDDPRVVAIVEAMPGHFEEDRHGNILAGSLTEAAQRGIAGVLNELNHEAVALMFEFALRHHLSTLLAGFDSFDGIDTLRAGISDELADAYASQTDNRHDYSETERWVLTRSGVWTADDLVRCFNRKIRGCKDWSGESPLLLLDVASERGRDVRTAGMLTVAMSAEDATEEEIASVLAYLSADQGTLAKNQLRSIINAMTVSTRPRLFRYTIAKHATEPLCSVEMAEEAARRVPSDDDRSQTSVWNTYLTTCNDNYWSWRERLTLSSLGSDLNAHVRILETILESAEQGIADASCDDVHAAAAEAYESLRGYDRFMTGLAFGLAGALRPDCFATLEEDLHRVARDEREHPEGRYKAIEILAAHGDRADCTLFGEIRRWTPGEDEPGFTPLAEQLELKARDACEASSR